MKTNQSFVDGVNHSGQVPNGKAVDGKSRIEPEGLRPMARHYMQYVVELAPPNKPMQPTGAPSGAGG